MENDEDISPVYEKEEDDNKDDGVCFVRFIQTKKYCVDIKLLTNLIYGVCVCV